MATQLIMMDHHMAFTNALAVKLYQGVVSNEADS